MSVLTGEDSLYFTSLANGAAGGILAASDLATETFVAVTKSIGRQELVRAREAWRSVSPMIPKLFVEANPMPLKHVLWRQGLLRSPECRLPLTQVSDGPRGDAGRACGGSAARLNHPNFDQAPPATSWLIHLWQPLLAVAVPHMQRFASRPSSGTLRCAVEERPVDQHHHHVRVR
jgi:hypothetical protein